MDTNKCRINNIHSIRREERKELDELNHKISFLREEGYGLFDKVVVNNELYLCYNGKVLPDNKCGHLCHLSVTKTLGYDKENPHKQLSYVGREDINYLFNKFGI